jgi:hypothetical protein
MQFTFAVMSSEATSYFVLTVRLERCIRDPGIAKNSAMTTAISAKRQLNTSHQYTTPPQREGKTAAPVTQQPAQRQPATKGGFSVCLMVRASEIELDWA